jgi:undecaprenyl-diphosphatase
LSPVRTTARRRQVNAVEVATVVGGSAALAGSWFIVAQGHDVPALEAHVFTALNDLPGALWPVLWPPMQLGSLPGSLVVAGATFAVSRQRQLTLATLVAGQAAWWSAKAVKAVVSRGRPAALLVDFHAREQASGVGYVSGHAAVAFALAAVLTPSMPRRWRPVAFGLATVVAFARIYAGAHLPLDAVGGAGLGLLVGTLARWSFRLGGEGLPVVVRD